MPLTCCWMTVIIKPESTSPIPDAARFNSVDWLWILIHYVLHGRCNGDNHVLQNSLGVVIAYRMYWNSRTPGDIRLIYTVGTFCGSKRNAFFRSVFLYLVPMTRNCDTAYYMPDSPSPFLQLIKIDKIHTDFHLWDQIIYEFLVGIYKNNVSFCNFANQETCL